MFNQTNKIDAEKITLNSTTYNSLFWVSRSYYNFFFSSSCILSPTAHWGTSSMQKHFAKLPLGPVPQIKQKTNKSSEKITLNSTTYKSLFRVSPFSYNLFECVQSNKQDWCWNFFLNLQPTNLYSKLADPPTTSSFRAHVFSHLLLIGEHHQCKKVIIHLLGPRQHHLLLLVQIILVWSLQSDCTHCNFSQN